MNSSHIEEILKIEQSVFPTPWTRLMFEQELARESILSGPGGYAVVAFREECVIGYSIAWFVVDEVHLVNVAVSGECQGQGIGSLLLNDLIDKACAEGKLIITLEVRKSNTGAQEFYRGFNFERIGVRPRYYSDNREDAVLMVLDLGPFLERRRRDKNKSQKD